MDVPNLHATPFQVHKTPERCTRRESIVDDTNLPQTQQNIFHQRRVMGGEDKLCSMRIVPLQLEQFDKFNEQQRMQRPIQLIKENGVPTIQRDEADGNNPRQQPCAF